MIGGSHGIGSSLVDQLKDRHRLIVASRTHSTLPDSVRHIPFDAQNDDLDTGSLPESLDGFVYLPGSIDLKPFTMLDVETFEKDMLINFFGMVKVLGSVVERMSAGASLVLFSSVAAGTGMAYHTSISAAKGAIEGFARAFAAEYAPKLRINVIAPSLVDTPLAKRLLNNDRKREDMASRHPLKKIGSPEDIAHMAQFLLSDDSRWITGQVLAVDGGLSTLSGS
ncbi:NAD(P)-dependent dehydrogenase, short-chain alcohol dehydrogenase family [Pseudozobellia thermophila]|uniref:NAD(P)-dependent dehydrogenase, short-chain alcohol dehydrogenase family n=2 Tax=Pseudozobellia thermophila TaxID=192903 RepID=A0A1M6LH84_9FLAO|nr:NAD(P)-dependent dehydrogenase, short-chain alcohol dehydrogenase family [Pseudozobellia thermophila]